MDERERRSDLRRRAIATLAMVAAGIAILPRQDEPPSTAHKAAPRAAPQTAPGPSLSLVRMQGGRSASGPLRPHAAALRRNK